MSTCLGPLMRRAISGIGFAFATVALAPAHSADAANFGTLSREPTPLVLKDGRIAKVSVHIVPFETGSAELSTSDRSSLMRTLVPMATDCFLTAQAVGHVEQTDGAEDDTMATHRLARARAEHVQKEMIELGLPSASIASVWDWQFLVRDARVTLWVFQLIRGEECEGRQLEEARLVAASLPKSDPQPEPSPQVVEEPEPVPEAEPDIATNSEPEVTPEVVAEPQGTALTPGDGVPEQAAEQETLQTAHSSSPSPIDEQSEAPTVDEPLAKASEDPQNALEPQTETADVSGVGSELSSAAAAGDEQLTDEATAAVGEQDALLKRKPPAEPDAAAAIDESGTTNLTEPVLPAEAPAAEPVEEIVVEADIGAETADDGVPPNGEAAASVEVAPSIDPVVEEAEALADGIEDSPTQTIIVDTSEEPAAGPVETAALAETEAELPLATLETEVTFAVNSSYMSGDDHQSLRSLLEGLPAPGVYRVVLTAAIGAGDVEASDPEEDKRYNRWMAERRIERVQTFLESNSGNREIEFSPAFAEDDNSREVRLQIVPRG